MSAAAYANNASNKLSSGDQEAADLLFSVILEEVYLSMAQALAQASPEVAGALFPKIESLVAGLISRINHEQSEGPASTAIALAVCLQMADLMAIAHRMEGRTAKAGSTRAARRKARLKLAALPAQRAA